MKLLYIDLFCGAGGTSTGVENARYEGRQCAKVIGCVNHDANAIASHAANHPDALHFTEDIRMLELSPLTAHIAEMRRQYPDAFVVLFDPPHLNNLGESSWLAKKYGRLLPSWEDDIRQGFEECMRVLKPNGTLIFKWNEQQIPTARIIEIIGQKPLFGHTSGKGGKTIWMCFLKNEKSNETHL